MTFSFSARRNFWSRVIDRAFHSSTDFVTLSRTIDSKLPILTGLPDFLVITIPQVNYDRKVLRPPPIIRSLHSTYLIDLLSDRIKFWVGGSALGSIELFWGGSDSFGRALLPNTFSRSLKIMPEIPNFPKWIGWYYLVGYAFIISVVAAITYF